MSRTWIDVAYLVAAILLIVGVFAFWQLLYWFAGEMAMRSPLQTIRLTADLLARPTMWPHISETVRAFAAALAIAVTSGVAIGLALRMPGERAAVGDERHGDAA